MAVVTLAWVEAQQAEGHRNRAEGHPEQGFGGQSPQGKGLLWNFCTETLLEETGQAEGSTLGATKWLRQVAGGREPECYQEEKPRPQGQTWA